MFSTARRPGGSWTRNRGAWCSATGALRPSCEWRPVAGPVFADPTAAAAGHDHADLQRAVVQHGGLPRPPARQSVLGGARRRARPGTDRPPDRGRAAAGHGSRSWSRRCSSRPSDPVRRALRHASHHRLVEATAALGRMDLEHPSRSPPPRAVEPVQLLQPHADRLGEASERSTGGPGAQAKVAERTAQLQQAQRHLLKADGWPPSASSRRASPRDQQPLSGVLNYAALMGRILKDDGVPKDAFRVPRLPRPRERADAGGAHRVRPPRLLAPLQAPAGPVRPERDLRATVGLVSHKLKLLNVEASLQLDEALPLLPCDASQMQQVVLNLVMNAAEARGAADRAGRRAHPAVRGRGERCSR